MDAKKQPKANSLRRPPLDVIQRAKAAGIRECIVAFSGGKDSIATIELCARHFDRVEAYHMHLVRGLSWDEEPIRWAEKEYGIKVLRVPHWIIGRLCRDNNFRHPTQASKKAPLVKPRDIYDAACKYFEIRWIATGERCRDSLERQAYIKNCEGVQRDWHRFFPVGFWREQDVVSFLLRHGLPTPSLYNFAESEVFKERSGKRREFGGFQMETVAFIRQERPDDYAKIKAMFPLIESQYVRWRALCEQDKVPKVDQATDRTD